MTIAPKEEEPEPEDNPDPEDEDTPKTGDPNNMMNWILILFGSSAALMSTALFTSRRKKTACK